MEFREKIIILQTKRDLCAFNTQLILNSQNFQLTRLLHFTLLVFIQARLFINIYHQVPYLDIPGSNLIKEVLHIASKVPSRLIEVCKRLKKNR